MTTTPKNLVDQVAQFRRLGVLCYPTSPEKGKYFGQVKGKWDEELQSRPKVGTPSGWTKATFEVMDQIDWDSYEKCAAVAVMGKVSNLMVIDIDLGGMAVWEKFLKPKWGDEFVQARTPSGGIHLYCEYDPNILKGDKVFWRKGQKWDIDIKTDGSTVHIPFSSRVEDGVWRPKYKWLTPPCLDKKGKITNLAPLSLLDQLEHNLPRRGYAYCDAAGYTPSTQVLIREELVARGAEEVTQRAEFTGLRVQPSEDTINYLLSLLSDERADNRTLWVQVASGLKRGLNEWGVDGYDYFVQFSMRSPKFDPVDCRKTWNSIGLDKKSWNFGSIRKWAKADNPEAYDAYTKANRNHHRHKLHDVHMGAAEFLKEVVDDLYYCPDPRKPSKPWITWDESAKLWRQIPSSGVKNVISPYLIEEVESMISALWDTKRAKEKQKVEPSYEAKRRAARLYVFKKERELGRSVTSEDKTEEESKTQKKEKAKEDLSEKAKEKLFKKQLDNLKLLRQKFCSKKYLEDITSCMEASFSNDKLLEEFDHYKNEVPVMGGYLYNQEDGSVRLRTKSDKYFQEAPVRVINSDGKKPRTNHPKVLKYMRALFPNEEHLRYVRIHTGYLTTGTLPDRNGTFDIGGGSNGKSKFIKNIIAMMGKELAGTIHKDLIIKTRKERDFKSPEKLSLLTRRINFVMETGPDDEIDTDEYKRITGGDTLNFGLKYSNEEIEAAATSKLVVCTNDLPKIEIKGKSEADRLTWVIPFETQFSDDPIPGTDQVLGDIELANWNCDGVDVDENGFSGRDYFFAWVMWGAQAFLADPSLLRSPPEEFSEARKAYVDSNDPIGVWLQNTYRVGELVPISKALPAKTLYETYKKVDETNAPSMISFNKVVSRIFPSLVSATSHGSKVYRNLVPK